MKKETRGGVRAGAGRKKGPPTDTISIRHSKKVVAAVKKKHGKKNLQTLGREWLDSLI